MTRSRFRSFFALFVIVIAVLVVSGCSNANGDPAQSARRWLEATLSGDTTTASNYTCSSLTGASQAGALALGGLIAAGQSVDASQLQYNVTDHTDTQASVHVTGNLTTRILNQPQTVPLDVTFHLIYQSNTWKVCS